MAKDIELAILFADVVGSTRLYEALGDDQARETVARCIDVMRLSTEQNKGTVIKTMGDEVMSTFPTADDALNAGAQMQRTIRDSKEMDVAGVHVAIRIGCHFGPVVLENRDIFGSTVHTANRMTSQAKASQILTTSLMVERLSPEWRAAVRQIDVAHVRGKADEMALYEVLWQAEDVTSMLPSLNLDAQGDSDSLLLVLDFAGRQFVLGDGRTGLSMGRADDNEIVIKGNLISRLHARIEMRKHKFVLVDQSTNGTFVLADDGEEIFVRRDSYELRGHGMISLGKRPQPDSKLVVRFRIEN